jgi:hypothetical protein
VFRNAHIGGQLDCAGAVFNNPRGVALNAELLTVDAHMSLHGAKCCGETQLPGAHIGGQLDCGGAVFWSRRGPAVNAESLIVDTDLVMRNAKCTGEVRLFGAHIKGQLNCSEATLCEPRGLALNAEGLTVGSSLYLGDAICTGEVLLAAAHIDGQLNCIQTVFSNPDGRALTAQRLSVTEDVYLGPKKLNGNVHLADARVGTWHDKKSTWPGSVGLNGFVYARIDGRNATINDRLRSWLPSDGYLPQPYEQLAEALRREGDQQAARKVLIGKQRARRAAARQWWRRWPSVAWSTVLRWTIGYGYRPALVLIPLALLLACGSVIFAAAYPEHLRPAKSGAEQPGFNSFRYTMDLLLPVANFKQRDAFVASEWAVWFSFVFVFAGWLLAAVVVAGLSGVFKRD